MFRILIVDDDPAAAHLLRDVINHLDRRHELHFASDGMEALDFLHCRGAHVHAPRPNLILLDMKMPRLSGLETLSAIKNDPELCVIPVIMLSSGTSPEEVRKCYLAHANCYVVKPTDLDRSMKLIQAIEAFWIDFALLPACDDKPYLQSIDSKEKTFPTPTENNSGLPIAPQSAEASSRAMRTENSPVTETATPSRSVGCEEHNRLLEHFGTVVHELLKLHEDQFLAIVDGDTDSHRFDLLIHMANEKKQLAKYDYLRHVAAHGCTNTDALNDS